jgi:phosphate:Na+ symporter
MGPESASLSVAAPEWLPLLTGLGGGLGLFLFGLDQMTRALKAVAGSRLQNVLATLTVSRLSGVATGAFVTAILQSSSVTTVLLVSFISSGLMTLSQSVGVILGANIGTTITAQIVAFKVTKLALGMIGVGFAVTLLPKRSALRHHGSGILGLGLIFLGMTVMSDSMAPLGSYPPFIEWMVRMEHPALGILAAAAFTGVVQSSSATTAIVIAMASQGLISLATGVALILGANVGTCITAVLASIGKPREAVRAALVHVIFNLVGVLLWLGFLDELAQAASAISPTRPALEGIDLLAAETPRQIANAHTLFNTINALLFLPFASLLARLTERLVPDRPSLKEELIRVLYLDKALLSTPSLALEQARRELTRLIEHVERMFQAALPAVLTGNARALDEVASLDDGIDSLYQHIVTYLGQISEEKLSDEETTNLMLLIAATNAIESIGDVIETDLVSRGRERAHADVRISPATRGVIERFHAEVARCLADMRLALDSRDLVAAQRVVGAKRQIQHLADEAARHQITRLVAHESHRLPAYSIETDIVEDLRRVYYFAKRVARGILAAGGEAASE